MKTEIEVLKAYNGDCILIKSYDGDGNELNILIDGGIAKTFDYALRKKFIGENKITVIHLLILTHIHGDHIVGVLRLLKSCIFNRIHILKYWINCKDLIRVAHGDKISFNQGIKLEELLVNKQESKEKWSDIIHTSSQPKSIGKGIDFKILSPTEESLDSLYSQWPEISKSLQRKLEDIPATGGVESQVKKGKLVDLAKHPFNPQQKIENDIENASSIALVITLPDTSILLLGDARAEIIQESLEQKGYWCEYILPSNSKSILSKKNIPDNTINKLNTIIDKPFKGSKNFKEKINTLIEEDEYQYINEIWNLSKVAKSNKLRVDFVKIAHHGSINNTSCELLDLLDCDSFIISTNGKRHKHPDRETIARIVHHKSRDYSKRRIIYFNYPLTNIERNAGILFEAEDFEYANWEYKENVNKLPE